MTLDKYEENLGPFVLKMKLHFIGVLTGHWFFGKHGNRLGITTSQSCRCCGDTDEGETTDYFLCSYPAFALLPLKTFEN